VDTLRLEAFSDGVFAIAITLLVLDVTVHAPGGHGLTQALLRAWPSYVGYAISFLTIGVIWVNHHACFRQIGRVDRVLLFLNLVFLLFVAFIPFPTRLLAEYVRTDGASAAAVVYGLTLTCTAICFNALWRYAARGGRLLRPDADMREVSGITRSFWPGAIVYGVATAIAFASAWASAALYGAIAVFYVLSSSFFGSEPQDTLGERVL
jgi:uncharacterized membrane protein